MAGSGFESGHSSGIGDRTLACEKSDRRREGLLRDPHSAATESKPALTLRARTGH